VLQAGTCDGMTYREVAERMPHEFELRALDKLRYRCALYDAGLRLNTRAAACSRGEARRLFYPCQRQLCLAPPLALMDRLALLGTALYRRYPSGESYMDVIQRLEPVVTGAPRLQGSPPLTPATDRPHGLGSTALSPPSLLFVPPPHAPCPEPPPLAALACRGGA
jgi:hypothetical protein